MIHLLSFALCLAGFLAIAFSTYRQQRDIIGRQLKRERQYLLRIGGTCALLLVLGLLIAWFGFSLGLVMFSGHTSLAAGIVYVALLGYSRTRPRALQRK
jgi:hypothetical protein